MGLGSCSGLHGLVTVCLCPISPGTPFLPSPQCMRANATTTSFCLSSFQTCHALEMGEAHATPPRPAEPNVSAPLFLLSTWVGRIRRFCILPAESWAPRCLKPRKGEQCRTWNGGCQFPREGTGTSRVVLNVGLDPVHVC